MLLLCLSVAIDSLGAVVLYMYYTVHPKYKRCNFFPSLHHDTHRIAIETGRQRNNISDTSPFCSFLFSIILVFIYSPVIVNLVFW